ncbi:hypothetical protein Daus18300_011040 [Diaporthe australafricana]|uniref:Uncharacterized protein n=1 Tax=Diaporthe australafricana TaxID=127596 RepID=A0ABR3W843_9PEZI
MASGSANVTTADGIVGWKEGPGTRGSVSLIWSCVIFIFACTWTVLHLNVPGQDEGPFQILLRKIKWMFINILFPEFIFSKAVCDLRLALKELQEFGDSTTNGVIEDSKWTMVYGGRYGHEWCWEIEFPQWTNQLYRLLFLKPPQPPFKETCWCLRYHAGHPRWTRWLHALLFLKPPKPQYEHQRLRPSINAEERPQSHGDCETGETVLLSDLGEDAAERDQHLPSQSKETAETMPKNRQTVQNWTVVHSYYAQMGGLLYLKDESLKNKVAGPPDYLCLTASKLTPRYCWLPTGHPLKHLVLDEKDIQDKSKADWFLKSIAMLQITWLSLSIAFRGVTGLPVTQLEIATIAFAVMALFAYMANWWKPKDVSQATILQSIGWCSEPRTGATFERTVSFIDLLRSPADAAESSQGVRNTKRVENDYVWVESDQRSMFILSAVSSLVFGGLHCLAWNFEFPTRIELICWRVASLTSAILPLTALTMSFILVYLSTENVDSRVLSTWLRKLEPLEKLSPEWLYRMENSELSGWKPQARVSPPRRFSGWNSFARVLAPAGSRYSEEEQSREGMMRLINNEATVLDDINRLIALLARFREVWETAYKLQKDRNNDENQIALVNLELFNAAKDLKFNLEACENQDKTVELWRDYEAFVSESEGNTTCMAKKTLIEIVISAYDEVSSLQSIMRALKQ